jgi:beta-glucosidase
MDATQPIEARVEHLLSQMTLREKVAQLGSYLGFAVLGANGPDPVRMKAVIGEGIGHISRVGGLLNIEPAQTAQIINAIQKFLTEQTRLGIPAIIHEECLCGYEAKRATVFPQNIGSASSFAPELVQKMTDIIRQEMMVVGVRQGLSPVLDVARDPRWGRTEETFGEDPYLVSQMGIAYVRGLQSDDLKNGVIATGKHFLGYSQTEGGMNWSPAHIPARELYEVIARPFEAVIREANLASIMNAYNELDGVPCGTSKEILTDLLRGKLGFNGIVVSDYFTIRTVYDYHHAAASLEEAAVQAVKAGLDIELPTTEGYGDVLLGAIEKGLVTEAEIDVLVRRVLEAKFKLGLFENPYADTGRVPEVYGRAESKQAAYELAAKSLVLLKNEGGLLPLKPDVNRIAVIGPNADSMRNLLGDYTYAGQLEAAIGLLQSNVAPSANSQLDPSGRSKLDEATTQSLMEMFADLLSDDEERFTRRHFTHHTVLRAIKDASSAEIRYAQGCTVRGKSREGFAEAVQIAGEADVAVLVLGEKSGLNEKATSGEARDRADLNLPGVQQDLLEAVYATGTPVVLVLINGRPLSLTWAEAHIPAIIEAWVPGEMGGKAIADALFGSLNPGGKLPISVPRSVGQVPVFYAHKPSGGRSHWLGDYVDESTKPLYPFGYGLSYTTFEYSNLVIHTPQVDTQGAAEISVDVTNTGKAAGDEVVQLYFHDREAAVTRPVKELVGFKRVTLAPGACGTVHFTVPMQMLGFYNREMRFVVEPGNIDVMIGSSSQDIKLTGEFHITGAVVEVSRSFTSHAVKTV